MKTANALKVNEKRIWGNSAVKNLLLAFHSKVILIGNFRNFPFEQWTFFTKKR